MRIKCKYCEEHLSKTDSVCPNCGLVNPKFKRYDECVPQTIEELKSFYDGCNLSPENKYFYIGENTNSPEAYGVYEVGAKGYYDVYKNTVDGYHLVYYRTTNEARAVGLLYWQMIEEMVDGQIFAEEYRKKIFATPENAVAIKAMRKIDEFDKTIDLDELNKITKTHLVQNNTSNKIGEGVLKVIKIAYVLFFLQVFLFLTIGFVYSGFELYYIFIYIFFGAIAYVIIRNLFAKKDNFETMKDNEKVFDKSNIIGKAATIFGLVFSASICILFLVIDGFDWVLFSILTFMIFGWSFAIKKEFTRK